MTFLQLKQWMENALVSHTFTKLPVQMPRQTSLFRFTIAKKPSGVLSFFRGTGGKSPDLSSQKKETLRGADSAYYQVGQMGKEGAENQGAEPQGTRLLSPPSVLDCYFSQTSFILVRLGMHTSHFFNNPRLLNVCWKQMIWSNVGFSWRHCSA